MACHDSYTVDYLLRPIGEPGVIVRNVFLLKKVKRDIIVEMILVINARPSACAVTEAAGCPGVEGASIGVVIKRCVSQSLRVLLDSEIADLFRPVWLSQV